MASKNIELIRASRRFKTNDDTETTHLKLKTDILVNDSDPTVYLQDTNGRSAFLHCNSDIFYILGSTTANAETWTKVGGMWPATWSLTNYAMTAGGSVTIGNGTKTDTNLIIKKPGGVSDQIQIFNGTTRIGEIGAQDTTWLRINQVTAKNIYTPRYIRADAGFYVDGTALGITGTGAGKFTTGNFTGTVTVNGQTTLNHNVDWNAAGFSFLLTSDTTRRTTLQWRQNTTATFTAYQEVNGDVNFVGAGDNKFLINGARTFTDDYHPNADKWTTARTITLGGDLTGSVSIDGSSNVSTSVTVNKVTALDDRDVKPNTTGISNSFAIRPFFTSYGGLTTATGNADYQDFLVLDTYADSTGGLANGISFDKSGIIVRAWQASGFNGTTWKAPQRFFLDNYHPNADKWTTARTITLGGDLTGSVSIDGSANVTLSAQVTNDSHTHAFNNLTNKTSGTGDYSTSGDLVSGRGSGGVALTINDGYGNANVTFNHQDGKPEQNGNAARIVVNTDASTSASMTFQLKSGVTGGTGVALTNTLSLTETAITFLDNTVWHAGNDGSGSTLDADLLDGAHGNTSATVFTGNQYVRRNGSGYIYSNYFNMSANDIGTGTPSRIPVETNNDKFLRWQTLANFESKLGTTASTVNRVVRRNSSGDINARLFRSEYDTTNANIGYIMTQVDTVSNNYIRPSTKEQTATAIQPFLQTAAGRPVAVASGGTVTGEAGDYIYCDTRTANCTVNLPSAPSDGDSVIIFPITNSTNSVIVNSSAKQFDSGFGAGIASPITMDSDGLAIRYTYNAALNRYLIISDGALANSPYGVNGGGPHVGSGSFIRLNPDTHYTDDLVVPASWNGSTAGPATVASGSVTITDGQTWTIF